MTVNQAREQFRPAEVDVLFIAEAPPYAGNRFFYFTEVDRGDALFLYVIRTVFPELWDVPVKKLREMKEELLYRFQEEGYFLEDSIAYPLTKMITNGQKLNLLKEARENLHQRIEQYKSSSRIVLLSSSVFKVSYKYLKDLGYDILNDEAIPLPGNGQQNKFKEQIAKIAFG